MISYLSNGIHRRLLSNLSDRKHKIILHLIRIPRACREDPFPSSSIRCVVFCFSDHHDSNIGGLPGNPRPCQLNRSDHLGYYTCLGNFKLISAIERSHRDVSCIHSLHRTLILFRNLCSLSRQAKCFERADATEARC